MIIQSLLQPDDKKTQEENVLMPIQDKPPLAKLARLLTPTMGGRLRIACERAL